MGVRIEVPEGWVAAAEAPGGRPTLFVRGDVRLGGVDVRGAVVSVPSFEAAGDGRVAVDLGDEELSLAVTRQVTRVVPDAAGFGHETTSDERVDVIVPPQSLARAIASCLGEAGPSGREPAQGGSEESVGAPGAGPEPAAPAAPAQGGHSSDELAAMIGAMDRRIEAIGELVGRIASAAPAPDAGEGADVGDGSGAGEGSDASDGSDTAEGAPEGDGGAADGPEAPEEVGGAEPEAGAPDAMSRAAAALERIAARDDASGAVYRSVEELAGRVEALADDVVSLTRVVDDSMRWLDTMRESNDELSRLVIGLCPSAGDGERGDVPLARKFGPAPAGADEGTGEGNGQG